MSSIEKTELRKKYKLLRDSVPNDKRHKLSQKIAENLFKTDFWKNIDCLTCFVSFGSEVETHSIISAALKQEKKIFVPKINLSTDEIEFFQITDFDKDLKMGSYGILEPSTTNISSVDSNIPNLHIIPGLVFDKNGFRIGYGKGYYDKFLKNVSPYAVKIALAFEFQIVEYLPHTTNDIPVDVLITENDILFIQEQEYFEDSEY